MSELSDRWHEMLREWNGGTILPGRGDHPAALFDCYHSGRFGVDLDLIAHAIEDAWTSAEFPSRSVDDECWVEFFAEVGFLDNGTRSDLPGEVPTLYRAAAVGHECGMAWTDNYEQALWFYTRNRDLFSFETVMVKYQPDPIEVLAHFHCPKGRNEDEWVITPPRWGDIEIVEVKK